jgi:hypothetical protein
MGRGLGVWFWIIRRLINTPDKMTFHHTFQSGHTATAELSTAGLRIEWTPDLPDRQTLHRIKAEYLRWMRHCCQTFADKVNGAVLYFDLATGRPELITPSK